MRIESQYTNRSLRALALYGGMIPLPEEFYAYKYDKVYAPSPGWQVVERSVGSGLAR